MKRADWDRIYTHFKHQTDEEHKEVVNLGGLHIIGTERHEARRIDNQLRGRAGRQGDPGSSRFFLSLEDDLMRIFGSDRISGLMQRLGMEEGVPIEHGMVTRAIERAQKQVEAQNFAVRKHLLEYDDVMNKQRERVYTLRREILEGKIHLPEGEEVDVRGYLLATAEDLFDERIEQFVGKDVDEEDWDIPALGRELTADCSDSMTRTSTASTTMGTEELGDASVGQGARQVRGQGKDRPARHPRPASSATSCCRSSISSGRTTSTRSITSRKASACAATASAIRSSSTRKKASRSSRTCCKRIEEEIVRYVWWLKPVVEREAARRRWRCRRGPRRAGRQALNYNNPSATAAERVRRTRAAAPAAPPPGGNDLMQDRPPARVGGDDVIKTVKREEPKIGRNDPCWCGSGKKFKKCHGQ